MATFEAGLAWRRPGAPPARSIRMTTGPDGAITSVTPAERRTEDGQRVALPGFVNAHSHCFHRALRGRSETKGGDFWTWRDLMYEAASRLTPETYEELATYVYAEMLLAGYTTVGEFHYLHHGEAGQPYEDPNAMGWALVQAARRSGIRLTLIDACYLQASIDGAPLEGVQQRFGDGSGERWSTRVDQLTGKGYFGNEDTGEPSSLDKPRLAVAIHSVRAVPEASMATVVGLAGANGWPIHAHLSEQRAENEACLKETGLTPTDLLGRAGAWTRVTTAVHATHLSAGDVNRLGLAGTFICACGTTERDLGDGVGPFADLAEAGCRLCIGSDSHAVIDPFEETRSLELNQRLTKERRGVTAAAGLLAAGTVAGAASLGWPSSGIEEGGLGDLVFLRTDAPRLAGTSLGSPAGEVELAAAVVFAAAPSDLDMVVVGGEVVVEGGEHVRLGPPAAVAERLDRAVRRLFDE